jgi:OHCU decarboxylase
VRLTRVQSRYVVAAAGVVMILLGLFPKIGAIVAAIPPGVLGGAALVMFGTVAVIGIQTLGRVDFHDDRNVVIVAVSLGLALVPVAFPTFFRNFDDDLQVIFGSGITLGAFAAILLNLFMNVVPGPRHPGEPTAGPPPRRLSLEEINALDRAAFVETFGSLFQGPRWIAEQAYEARPFATLAELRRAFQDAIFEAPPERVIELIRAYPRVGRMARRDETAAELGIPPEQVDALMTVSGLGPESLRDQASAGLDRLSRDEFDEFDRLNRAYEERFGFPFIIAVREHTKDGILSAGRARLDNGAAQERAAALVEIAKIANLRLLDIAEDKELVAR